MMTEHLHTLPTVGTLQKRGVETSTNRIAQPRQRWFFCAQNPPGSNRKTPLSREGDEYNTLRGNKSAVRLYRFEPPGTHNLYGYFRRKQTEAAMPKTPTPKQYRAVSIRTRKTFTVIAPSIAGALALLPAGAAIIRRTPVNLPNVQEVAS